MKIRLFFGYGEVVISNCEILWNELIFINIKILEKKNVYILGDRCFLEKLND